MKNLCIECGQSHGNHHVNCPEIPEIQSDADIEITCEAEDNFNQFDLIP